MKLSTTNPFIGLRPYQAEHENDFFGREQEVENLLSVLQKNKIAVLTGDLGSGKTSLIQAGLIPKLLRGFTGQTSNEWSIAFFRPGISPLKNLSHALTENNVLKVDLKSNTSDYSYYNSVFDKFQDHGLIEIFNNSEINGKRNLLIVIDQLEDLFKYQKFFNSSTSDEDNLLMDIIYKTVSTSNISVYFLICIQTPYLTRITAYTKLQELVSKTQYAIQSIRYEDIENILKDTFYIQNISFSDDVIEYFRITLNEDMSYLPNFQYLLKKVYNDYVIKNTEIDLVDMTTINALGGIENVLAKDLSSLYDNQKEVIRYKRPFFYRSTANFENFNDNAQYESIGNISRYIDIPIKELTDLIQSAKSNFGEIYDVFKPVITGVPISEKKPFGKEYILNLKYFKNLNWEQRISWLKEEEDAFLKLKEYNNDAIKYKNGLGDYLSGLELENAKTFRDKLKEFPNWADKYSYDYNSVLNFINESEAHDEKIKNDKIQKALNQDKKDKRNRNIITGVAVLAVILAFTAFFQMKVAKVDRKEALDSREQALAAKEKSDSLSREAHLQRYRAKNAEKVAINSAIEAVKAQDIAERAKLKLELKNDSIIKQNEIILKAKETIENQRSELEITNKESEEKSEKMTALKEIIEIKSQFKDLNIRLVSAYEEDDLPMVTDIIEESLNKQEKFDSLQNLESLKDNYIGNEDVIGLNQEILSVLEKKSRYSETSMLLDENDFSIRSFDTKDDIVAYVGDDGFLRINNFKNNSRSDAIKISDKNPISDRLRNVLFIDTNTVLVNTFSNKLFKVNIDNALITEIDLKFRRKENSEIIGLYGGDGFSQTYVVLSNKILSYSTEELKTEFSEFKNITCAYLSSKNELFIINDNKAYVLLEDSRVFQLLFSNNVIYNYGVTAIETSNGHLFLGCENGKVFHFSYNLEDIKNLNKLIFYSEYSNHKSRVTKLLYDYDFSNNTNILYTASLDNKIYRYDYNLKPIDNVKNEFIELKGHEKWIWDMDVLTNIDGKKLLITADEDGNLLSWYTNPKDLIAKIKKLKRD